MKGLSLTSPSPLPLSQLLIIPKEAATRCAGAQALHPSSGQHGVRWSRLTLHGVWGFPALHLAYRSWVNAYWFHFGLLFGNNKNTVNNQQVLRKKNQSKQVTIKNTSDCFQALIHCTYFWFPLLNIVTAFYWVLTSLAHDLPSVTWSVGSMTRIQTNLA